MSTLAKAPQQSTSIIAFVKAKRYESLKTLKFHREDEDFFINFYILWGSSTSLIINLQYYII